jgi:hypothetical protein
MFRAMFGATDGAIPSGRHRIARGNGVGKISRAWSCGNRRMTMIAAGA